MSIQSLRDQQRRTRNISRRWAAGYCSDELMARAEIALAREYEDAATWAVDSTALQKRYYRLAAEHANVSASLNVNGYTI